ncbi:MAG: NAD(P)H-dependent oxidoreductase [Phycisphaeraceae bacterium]|nr:NAD(P)H-dependent oxidoreductase [Phycisphaeraceae bacterium]
MSHIEAFLEPGSVKHRRVDAEHLLNNLKWRYAVKKFDPARKIDTPTWKALEQAAIHSPSSFGLQPWKFVVVEDAALRQQLRGASFNQSQITDASHLVVFARRTTLGQLEVDRYIDQIAAVRAVEKQSLADFRNTMIGFSQRPGFDVGAWAGRQVYIALGVFLTSAAMLGVDACPMEGFDPVQYDRILGLTEHGLAAQVVATAGYRASDDPFASLKKVRFHDSDVILRR